MNIFAEIYVVEFSRSMLSFNCWLKVRGLTSGCLASKAFKTSRKISNTLVAFRIMLKWRQIIKEAIGINYILVFVFKWLFAFARSEIQFMLPRIRNSLCRLLLCDTSIFCRVIFLTMQVIWLYASRKKICRNYMRCSWKLYSFRLESGKEY